MNLPLSLNPVSLYSSSNHELFYYSNDSIITESVTDLNLQTKDFKIISVFSIAIVVLFILNLIELSSLTRFHSEKLGILIVFAIFLKIFYLFFAILELKNIKKFLSCKKVSIYKVFTFTLGVFDMGILFGICYFYWQKVQ
ncbi:hypothetical protein CWI38_0193p0020 [Hamiltosporidium tvaerminnensis]|uniref:Uncharacterized protein n=1 Tax=Hamiltosporidium tvaerminnensis TaxID=1176355 RepID=A0A4Q9LZQ8_9MICR|nr:hypothetical protein CWI38_0193p0020 [Hamiltosporidium tvaerminnensis]